MKRDRNKNTTKTQRNRNEQSPQKAQHPRKQRYPAFIIAPAPHSIPTHCKMMRAHAMVKWVWETNFLVKRKERKTNFAVNTSVYAKNEKNGKQIIVHSLSPKKGYIAYS
jgi:hypothetical protein